MRKKAIPVGSVNWMDLTVPNASEVREFYAAVVGWKSVGLNMGGYEDYCMNRPKGGKTVAGICHKRGANKDLPAAWLIYITVADLDASLKACKAKGGKVLRKIRDAGAMGRYVVIQDPAGAVCALFQPA